MTFYNIPPINGGGGGGAVDSVFGRTGDVEAQAGDYNTDLVTESATRKYYRPLYSEQSITAGTSTNFPISESLNGWNYCSVDITINEDGEDEVNAFSLEIMYLSTGPVIVSTEEYANENTFVEYGDFSVSILSGTLNLGVQSHGSGQTLSLRLGNVLIF